MMEYLVTAVCVLIVAVVVLSLLKKLAVKAVVVLINSIAGLLILMFLNTYLGWGIPVTIPTLIVCGLFGVAGIGALIVLNFFGAI